MALKFAGSDGAAVENESGNIQASQRHNAAGNRLVAADENDQCIEKISASDKFNRVGNDFAADQRSFHPFGAHGNAIGDGNSIELERRAAGFADAVFYMLRELAQVVVAGADFNPGVGDADQRFGKVFVR